MKGGAAFLVLAAGSCLGAHAGQGPVSPGERAPALRAFQRDLGLESGAGPSEEEKETERDPEVDRDRVPAWIREDRSADDLLVDRIRKGGLKLENLPPAKGRVEILARARGLIALDRLEDARRLLRRLLREEPSYFPARVSLGWILLKEGENLKAAREFRAYLDSVPGNERVRIGLARSLLAGSGERAAREGVRILEDLVEKGDRAGDAARILAEWFLEYRKNEEALALVRKALKKLPGKGELRVLLGKILRYGGRYEEARRVLEPLAGKEDPWRSAALRELVSIERTLGNPKAALEHFRKMKSLLGSGEEGEIAGERLRRLEKDLEEELRLGRRVSYTLPELRVLLHRSEKVEKRLEALRVLLRFRPRGLEEDLLESLRKDEDPRIRSIALRNLRALHPRNTGILEIALHDRDPQIRKLAVAMWSTLPSSVSLPRLKRCLEEEEEPAVFRRIHEALSGICGDKVFLGLDQESKPEGREAARRGWREVWKRTESGSGKK